MRTRLREQSVVDYEHLDRDTMQFDDHVVRVFTSAGLAASRRPTSLLDPACGDAIIPILIHRLSPLERVVLADLSKPALQKCQQHVSDGVLPGGTRTLEADLMAALDIPERFDLVVLTEILEHLQNPEDALRRARERGKYLLASSPVFDSREMRSSVRDPNLEHVWQFDFNGYQEMLAATGWRPLALSHLSFPDGYYQFQMWLCE